MKKLIFCLILALFACEGVSPNIQIGDEYKDGIVFYIFQEGDQGYDPAIQHGFTVSKYDLYEYQWGCTNVSENLFTDNGSENIDIIISYCGEETAAYYCYFEGWSLPSRKELELIVESGILYNETDYYWSSNKHSYTEAISVRLSDGDVKPEHVYHLLKIRGIKEF